MVDKKNLYQKQISITTFLKFVFKVFKIRKIVQNWDNCILSEIIDFLKVKLLGNTLY